MLLTKHRALRFLLFGLCLPILVACNGLNNPPEITSSPTMASIFTVSGLGDTKIYTDEKIGFSFTYPAGWKILESVPGSRVMITSPHQELSTEQAAWGITLEDSKIDFLVLPEGTTLESAADDQRKQPNTTVTLEESLTLPSEFKAYRLELNTAAGKEWVLLVEVNGRIVQATAFGVHILFYDVAGTLRPSATT